ncbi:MAG: nuclear transport factor 2 family protein [Candidatus Dormibacteria bacterium]
MATDTRSIVEKYLNAVATGRLEQLEGVIHPDVTFSGTVSASSEGYEPFVDAFRRLGPIIERYDIRDMVVEGDRAFVLYDFVTNTEVGPVLSAEHITVQEGMVRSVVLLFDLRRWPEVMAELKRRAEAPVTANA